MKKTFWIFVMLCVTVAVFCGCTDDAAKEYSKLDNLLAQAKNRFTLTVSTDADTADALSGTFVVSTEDGETTVRYTVERFTDFSEGVPESYKKQLCGTVVLKNGTITQQSGDALNLAFDKLADLKFGFKAENFRNADWTNGFSADVVKPAAFMAGATNCTDMKLKVVFAESLQSLQITYTSQSGAKVLLQYDFVK